MKQQKIFSYKVILEEELDRYKKPVFVTYVPKLGISDFGNTVEKALEHTKEAIECHLKALILNKEEIPEGEENKTVFVSDIPVKVNFTGY